MPFRLYGVSATVGMKSASSRISNQASTRCALRTTGTSGRKRGSTSFRNEKTWKRVVRGVSGTMKMAKWWWNGRGSPEGALQ